MRTAVVFVILISSLEGFLAEEPGVYIQVSWDMSWRRFCFFIPLFREEVSRELIEMKSDNTYKVVNETRVRLMNDKNNCAGEGSGDDAVVEFFVSKSQNDLSASDLDRNITIRAYKILHDYWRNKKMVLLDPIFLGKVNKVELMGTDKPDIPEGLSEVTRVGIGIVVGLAIAFTIAVVFLCLSARRQMKQRPPHGIPLNVLPSEPKITMVDDPAAYDINKQDAQQYYRQDEPQYDQQYDQQDGFARQNSGSVHGYAVHHNTRYDDEPLGSPML